MLGQHNKKEQALALLAGNGLVVLHVASSIRDNLVPSMTMLGTLATMGAVSVLGVMMAFLALGHATELEKDDFEGWAIGAFGALAVSFITLAAWFLNIGEIVQRHASGG